MNIKTPFRKLRKHTFPFYLLLFLFLSNYILNVSFVLRTSVTYRIDLSITYLAIGFIVAVLFFASKISNPGILKPQTATGNLFQILVKNKPTEICFDCKVPVLANIDSKTRKIETLRNLLVLCMRI